MRGLVKTFGERGAQLQADRALPETAAPAPEDALAGPEEGGQAQSPEPAFSRKKNPWLFRAGLVLVIVSIASGLATYAVLTGLTPIRPAKPVVVTMLRMNGVLIAAMLLQRFRLEPAYEGELRIRQMPTLSPRDGLPVTIRSRG